MHRKLWASMIAVMGLLATGAYFGPAVITLSQSMVDTRFRQSFIRVCDGDCPTWGSASAAGDLAVEGDAEIDGATDLDGALSVAGAATLATTLDVTGTTTVAGLDVTSPAALLSVIRFCGNGPNDGTAHYMGPVLLDDTEADLAFGGAGCDALDNATEGTADEPWHSSFAFKPVAMVCVGRCTGATAANDAVVFQLRDDTADVAGMTCTAPAWSDDDVPSQCTVRDPTPATVAANSAIAISVDVTDDDCDDAGDDFECLLYVTF